jgi:hypothetical protein
MKTKRFVGTLLVLLALLVSVSPIGAQDATPSTPVEPLSTTEEGVMPGRPISDVLGPIEPAACPAGCGLPDSVESAAGFPFCVYFDSGDTTLAQAQQVRTYTDDYWDVYLNDYGWAMPTEYAGGKFKVCLVDSGTTCNGSVTIGSDFMTVYEGCDSTSEMMMAVVGHELAHAGPQLGPQNLTVPNFDALWAHEGMARSGEDKIFDAVDNNPNAMTQPFFNDTATTEIYTTPNHDLTANAWRYESAI